MKKEKICWVIAGMPLKTLAIADNNEEIKSQGEQQLINGSEITLSCSAIYKEIS